MIKYFYRYIIYRSYYNIRKLEKNIDDLSILDYLNKHLI